MTLCPICQIIVPPRNKTYCSTKCSQQGLVKNKIGVPRSPHHIKPFARYPELRLDVDNGVTLCLRCHNLTKRGRAT